MNKQINCTIEDESLLPKYETVRASGMDLKANQFMFPGYDVCDFEGNYEQGVTLFPMERVLIKTGLHIELPEDVEAQIRPRSGLALNKGISIVNAPGTVDEDFRGDIGVILINLSEEPFRIKKGDKIAQMVFQKVEKFDLNIVSELSKTVRGEGGFGHTGV
jgi:dUTP pyrophosphatase